jgi:hypothetical protein
MLPAGIPSARSATGLAALLASLALAAPATAADVQANHPQVAGDPTSDATARFPTNKQNEPAIAVDPTDANRLIAGSNDEQEQPPCGPGPLRGPDAAGDCSFFPGVGTDGVYTSDDAGRTWTNRGLLDDQPSWRSSPYVSDGDPVIVFGPKPDVSAPRGFSYANGARAYYVGLASYKGGQSPVPPQKAPELIVVSHSDDGGVTWSPPVRATTKNNPNTFNDKNSAWADKDPASPFFGNVYVGFTQFRSGTTNGFGNEPVGVARSVDGGESFGAPQSLSPAGNNGTGNGRQGTDIVTGPDGSVYVAFEQGSQQVVAISRDGGRSYGKAVAMGPVADIQDPIPGANFRTDSFASIAADPRAGSSTLYASWATRTTGGGRIVVARSTDKGASWGPSRTVSTALEGYAFFNGMDVAPDGRVDIGYQALVAKDTATFGTGNAAIDAWYVRGTPGGGAYDAPRKVSAASSDPAASAQNNYQRQFWGDYNTLVSGASTAWFISTDSRTGAGCPAVDAYQRDLAASGTAEPEEREAPGAGTDAPADANPLAPERDCPPQFGNTDVYVALVTP